MFSGKTNKLKMVTLTLNNDFSHHDGQLQIHTDNKYKKGHFVGIKKKVF